MSWLSSILSGAPGKDKFARIVCDFIGQAEPEYTTRYYPDQFAIHKLDKNGNVAATLYLGNAYSDYCRAPRGKRKDVLAVYFIQAAPLSESLHDSMPYILAHIQPRIFLEATRLSGEIMGKRHAEGREGAQADGDGSDSSSGSESSDSGAAAEAVPEAGSSSDAAAGAVVGAGASSVSGAGAVPEAAVAFPAKQIGEHFVLLLVRDTPLQLMYLSNKIFGDWQTSFDDLLDRAITNLTRLTPEPFQRVQQGVYYSHYHDNHDASRLLVKHRVEECRVKGRPLAFIPNRDSLFITGDEDEAGVAVVLPMVAEILAQPRSMPLFPLVYEAGEWQQWVVPDDHPQKVTIENMILTSFNEIYYNQKDLLDQKHQQEGADLFAASYMLYQHHNSPEYFSCSTWTSGIVTLLPECQYVGFVDWKGTLKEGQPKNARGKEEKQGEVLLTAPWSVVQSVMGEAMQLMDYYPPRYLVKEFPTAEQMNEMRKLMPEDED